MSGRLSEEVWGVRFMLEERFRRGDPSFVWVGELANLLEEFDVKDLGELRDKLDAAWRYEELSR